jgi:hypothetical protein
MRMGYEDGGHRVKLVFWPKIWRPLGWRRNLKDRAEDGKQRSDIGYIRFPYSRRSANGWNPFTNRQETPQKVSRWAMQQRRGK